MVGRECWVRISEWGLGRTNERRMVSVRRVWGAASSENDVRRTVSIKKRFSRVGYVYAQQKQLTGRQRVRARARWRE